MSPQIKYKECPDMTADCSARVTPTEPWTTWQWSASLLHSELFWNMP